MKHIRRLARLALTIITMAALSVGAFAAEYCFETGAGTEYYPATSYGDTYGTAYNFGGPNPMDYQIPELPYGVSGTTQIGIMEKGYLPGLQQNAGTSILNCTPFVRQYDILFNKWGVLLCQKEYQTNDIRRNSKNWLWKPCRKRN